MTTTAKGVIEAIDARKEDLEDALVIAVDCVAKEIATKEAIEDELSRLAGARMQLVGPLSTVDEEEVDVGDEEEPPAPVSADEGPPRPDADGSQSNGSAPEDDPPADDSDLAAADAEEKSEPKPAGLNKIEQGLRTRERVWEAVRAICADAGRVYMRELHTRLDLSPSATRKHLNALVEEGKLETHGVARSNQFHYTLVERVVPVTPPAERKKPSERRERTADEVKAPTNETKVRQPASLEGRVLAWFEWHEAVTGPQLSLDLDVSLNELRPVLGKLMREGELRTRKKGGDVLYVKAMAG